MQYTVQVSSAYIADKTVKNEKLNKEVVLINLGLDQPIEIVNKETGERTKKRQLTLQIGDFQSLIAKNGLLIHMNQYNNRELMQKFNLKEMEKETENGKIFVLVKEVLYMVEENGQQVAKTKWVELTEPERVRLRYDEQLKKLCGATIVMEKVEIMEPDVDEDGNVIMDNEGNPKEHFKGFGETIFRSVQLDKIGQELAEDIVFAYKK